MSTDVLTEKFEPVRTLEELDTLNSEMMVAGYMAGRKGYPEPEIECGKSFWHGWRNGMIDTGRMQQDDASLTLARLIVERSRKRTEALH